MVWCRGGPRLLMSMRAVGHGQSRMAERELRAYGTSKECVLSSSQMGGLLVFQARSPRPRVSSAGRHPGRSVKSNRCRRDTALVRSDRARILSWWSSRPSRSVHKRPDCILAQIVIASRHTKPCWVYLPDARRPSCSIVCTSNATATRNSAIGDCIIKPALSQVSRISTRIAAGSDPTD